MSEMNFDPDDPNNYPDELQPLPATDPLADVETDEEYDGEEGDFGDGHADEYADDDSGSLSRITDGVTDAEIAEVLDVADAEDSIAASIKAGLIDLEDPRVIEHLQKHNPQALKDAGIVVETARERTDREQQEEIDAIPEPVFPDGHPYFTVANGNAGSGKTVHIVAHNHVTKYTGHYGKLRPREFKPLTTEMAELLVEVGFTHCKVCAKSVTFVKQTAALTPLIDKFAELATEAAQHGVEIRLMAYPGTGAKIGSGREVFSSIEEVRKALK